MPREARLLLPNACYHVATRGIRQKEVFAQDADYNTFLAILLNYKRKYDFKLYAWCLMLNHVHLLIESELLPNVMHGINMKYAQYFLGKYNLVGHLWQNRYKSYVIQKDQYMINCITYIEMNPVRAGLVARPEDYLWNSYRTRVLGHGRLDLLDIFYDVLLAGGQV